MSTPWHRHRREMTGRPRHVADGAFATAILALIAGTLLTATTGLWMMSELEQFGPSVGGIIVLKPDVAATERWSVSVAVVEPARPGFPEQATIRRCNLTPNVMAVHGGSLVIEARRLTRPPVYRVHWAGGPTDMGSTDCGTITDIMLERTDLMRLANVAGGFSSGLRLIGP